MLYETYQNKIRKVASVLRKVLRFLPLIIAVVAVLVIAVTAALIAKGSIISFKVQESFEYGDALDFGGNAFLSKVEYEYDDGSGSWSANEPRFPGNYRVRAVAKTTFGGVRRSEPKSFAIVKRPVSIKFATDSFVYGDTPRFAADLASGDTVKCQIDYTMLTPDMSYSDSRLPDYKTTATPRIDTLVILDENGNDVTSAYKIISVESEKEFKVTRRAISIKTVDATKIYDGTPLFCDKYEIKDGSVASGERLEVVLSRSKTTVGENENVPIVNIYDKNGEQRNQYYDITVVSGMLTVEPRPIKLKLGSGTYTYTGENISHREYKLVADASNMSLVDGHSIGMLWNTVINAGEYENTADARIYDENGTNVTENYKITVERGRLTVEKFKLTVSTRSFTTVYSDTPKNTIDSAEVGALANRTHRAFLSIEMSSRAVDVGVYENSVVVNIRNLTNADVTQNYDITYNFGTLTIEKRPIHIKTWSAEFIYSGEPFSKYGVEIVSEYGLVGGHRFVCSNMTEITDVGTVANVMDVSIIKGASENVTKNYDITIDYGMLTVEPRPITFAPEFLSKVYDDTPLYARASLEVAGSSPYSICSGHEWKASVQVSGSITDVGYAESNVTDVTEHIIYDADGRDVTHNYNISYTSGALRVTPRPITVTTGSAEKIYDDTPLTEYSATIDDLVEGHEFTLTIISLRTDAGASYNQHKEGSLRITRTSDGKDVTGNYDPTYEHGILTVHPRRILIKTASAQKVYDGTPLTKDLWWIDTEEEGFYDLVEGHILYLKVTGLQTDAGSSYNTVGEKDLIVIGNANINKTHNYEFAFDYGILSVLRRSIVIKTASASKVYDGKVLTDGRYWLSESSPYGLVDGHTLSVTVTGARTDAGESPNVADEDATSITRKGVNVTTNYSITYIYGTLTVLKRDIIVETGSAEKVYDGTPLRLDKYYISSLSPYGLVAGHNLFVTVTGERTDVGIANNICDEGKTRISDLKKDNRDVTSNYNIKYKYGTLTVTPRPITVLTGSATKKYDGTPLTSEKFSVLSYPYQLVSGHKLSITTTGSRTYIGTSPNTCDESATKITANGIDVTSNYQITYELGGLTVTENEEKPDDGHGKEDDEGEDEGGGSGGLSTDGTIAGGSDAGEHIDEVFIKIRTDKTGVVYLKLKSFGDYTGTSWEDAAEYINKISGIYSADYLAGLAIGAPYSKAEIESLKGQYFLPYYMSLSDVSGYTPQSSDVFYTGNESGIYTVYYSTYDYGDVLTVPSSYKNFEMEYRAFVDSEYLAIDAETLAYMQKIIKEQGFEGNSIEMIQKVAKYIQSSAKYNLEYDPALDGESNIAVAFLDKYKEGICQHYASAATLLFRAMGIPARYTIGFMADTSAGKWVDVTGAQAHAWVEVYIDGMGWIQLEVTGGGNAEPGPGPGTEEKPELVLTPEYQYKYYDGKPLEAVNRLAIDSELKKLLESGYKYEVRITGTQTEIGRGASTIESFRLYDPDGKDVTDEFEIRLNQGVLEVVAAETYLIYVHLYQISKYYDGKPLTFMEGDYYIAMPDDVDLAVTLKISLTEVGCLTLSEINQNWSDYVDITVHDEKYKNVEFKIKFIAWRNMQIADDTTFVPITVEKRPLTIIAESAEKEYDGKPLEANEYYIAKGSVCEGHTIKVEVRGSRTLVGESANEIVSVVILDEKGNDVTENYDIECIDGLLTVIS